MLLRRAAALVRGSRALSTAADTQYACLDPARSVLRLEGKGLLEHLNKIISNDATKLAPRGAPPLYACVLTPQGRFLHDVFLHRAEASSSDAQAVLVDCDARQRRNLMDLLQHSVSHKLDVGSASKHYSVWAAFGGTASDLDWPTDPRLPTLGSRAILPRGSAPKATTSAVDYARWRIKQGVAEGDGEVPSGEGVPLEFNLDRLNGISLDKGPYVGQEFVARVHALGVVRKRVMPFRLGQARGASCISSVPLAPGHSRIFDMFDSEESLKPIGTVRALQGEFGLAKLRLKEAMAAIREEKPLLVGGPEAGMAYAEVWPWRPEWWAPSWGHEEEEEEPLRQVA